MTSPPGVVAHTSTTRGNRVLDMQALQAAAQTILWNCGIDFGPNKITRLCLRFAQRVAGNGYDFFDFIANQVELSAEERRRALHDPEVVRVISYADPTGEAAVRNVMRGAR